MTEKQIIQRCRWIESHMKKIRAHVEAIEYSDNPLGAEIAQAIEDNHLVNHADAEDVAVEVLENYK